MKKTIVIASLLAGISTPALADSIEPRPDDIIVVTASRIALEPSQIGSALTVISREELRQGQIIFARDALQDLAGVQISTDRPGNLGTVSLRGSENNQVLWLMDGIRLGDPSSISTEFQSENLVSNDIARIEVLRGNQSSLYGSDAIGGVINIITRRASEDGFEVSAEGEGGSYGTVTGGASVLGKSGPFDFRLTATGYSHDGPSLADPLTANPAGSVTEKDSYWRYGFSGRAGFAVTDTLTLQAHGYWQKAHTDLDGSRGDSSDIVGKREYAVAVKADYLSADRALRADASVSRYRAQRDYFGVNNLPNGDIFKGTKDAANLNIGYNGALFSVAIGGSLEREKANLSTRDYNFFPAFVAADLNVRIDTKAAYGEIALRPMENLTITGAARIDDNSRFGKFDTYRGTIAYIIPDVAGADSVKLRASYGSGAKAPGLYQLFDPTYGNANLKVENSEGGDIGFDVNFTKFTAQFSYFFGKTKNEIIFDPFAGPFGFGGYAQFGRTRKSGIEASFVLMPVAWMEVRQSFTYLDARTDANESGLYLNDPARPRRSGSTAVTLTPVERLSLTARARYRSGTDTTAVFGGITAPYAVVDLLAAYGITDRIEVYGRVTNLFDKQYQMTYGTNALDRAAYGGIRVKY